MSTGRAAATMAAGRMGRWLVAELAGAGVVALDRRRPESGALDLPAVDRIRRRRAGRPQSAVLVEAILLPAKLPPCG
jgi:nucleoside-diphosphate-sugar epimerase